jgi:hypothetical protein
VQTKEKFGSARYYWRLADEPPDLHVDVLSESGSQHLVLQREEPSALARQIRELVDAETARTHHLCIACGEPGEVYTQGWHLVMCPTHTEERRRGTKLRYWLEADEDISA